MEASRHFHVEGLDCTEEVRVLERELGPLVGQDNLRFEVLDGRLAILAGANGLRLLR